MKQMIKKAPNNLWMNESHKSIHKQISSYKMLQMDPAFSRRNSHLQAWGLYLPVTVES